MTRLVPGAVSAGPPRLAIGSGGTGPSPARLIAAGELPVLRLSARVVRIAPADLDAYIKARRESR